MNALAASETTNKTAASTMAWFVPTLFFASGRLKLLILSALTSLKLFNTLEDKSARSNAANGRRISEFGSLCVNKIKPAMNEPAGIINRLGTVKPIKSLKRVILKFLNTGLLKTFYFFKIG